jgi:transposase
MSTEPRDQPTSWLEGRRLRAWELYEQGWKQTAIAAALGVTRGAVSQWINRGRDGGRDALRHQPPPGAPARLTPEHLAQLPALLAKGAPAYGFAGDLWTAKRVAVVIHETFGVRYHPTHVSRLLKRLGLTPQLPTPQATQRDPAAVEAWYAERWPTVKKTL